MLFNVSEVSKRVFQYRNIWNEVEFQLFEKFRIEPEKTQDKFLSANRIAHMFVRVYYTPFPFLRSEDPKTL